MNRIDPRVKQLVRENTNSRLHVLIILWAMQEPGTAKDIAAEINCHADTVQAMLPRMEHDGYVSRVGAGRHPRWTLTDKARQLHFPNLLQSEGEFFTLTPSSSSSSMIYSSKLDQSENQTEEEEEGSTPEERAAIADRHRLTGRYRDTVLADPWITARRFEGWLAAAKGKRNPAAYAVTCCSNHDEPPEPTKAKTYGDILTEAWGRYGVKP